MTAAYRFFDNDKVDFDGVLQPHIECHAHRGSPPKPVVLLVHDTTEVDLTRPQQQVQAPARSMAARGAACSCT